MRIADVRVDRASVSTKLRAARDVYRRPVGVVEVRLPEIERTPRGVSDPLDLPVAVQRDGVGGRGLNRIRKRRLLIRKTSGFSQSLTSAANAPHAAKPIATAILFMNAPFYF